MGNVLNSLSNVVEDVNSASSVSGVAEALAEIMFVPSGDVFEKSTPASVTKGVDMCETLVSVALDLSRTGLSSEDEIAVPASLSTAVDALIKTKQDPTVRSRRLLSRGADEVVRILNMTASI